MNLPAVLNQYTLLIYCGMSEKRAFRLVSRFIIKASAWPNCVTFSWFCSTQTLLRASSRDVDKLDHAKYKCGILGLFANQSWISSIWKIVPVKWNKSLVDLFSRSLHVSYCLHYTICDFQHNHTYSEKSALPRWYRLNLKFTLNEVENLKHLDEWI